MAGSADNAPRVDTLDLSKRSHKKLFEEDSYESNRAAAEAAGYTWTKEDEAAAHQAAEDERTGGSRDSSGNGPGRRPGPMARAARATGVTTPVSSGGRGLKAMMTGNNAGGTMAGFLFGFGAYCVALNFLRYGPKGAVGWLTAKFVNEPYNPTTGATATTSTPTALNATPVKTASTATGAPASAYLPMNPAKATLL